MLNVLSVKAPQFYGKDVPFEQLFSDNYSFVLEVEAPIYWWADFDGVRFYMDLSFLTNNPYQEPETVLLKTPVSTKIKGCISLPYQSIIEICEDYKAGAYVYKKEVNKWPNEREWNDLCETLMDIRGIRYFVEKET